MEPQQPPVQAQPQDSRIQDLEAELRALEANGKAAPSTEGQQDYGGGGPQESGWQQTSAQGQQKDAGQQHIEALQSELAARVNGQAALQFALAAQASGQTAPSTGGQYDYGERKPSAQERDLEAYVQKVRGQSATAQEGSPPDRASDARGQGSPPDRTDDALSQGSPPLRNLTGEQSGSPPERRNLHAEAKGGPGAGR
jgi:hypothetical protein